jgi:hypothetical protein
MANVKISGDTSGYVDLQAPDVAGTTVITLPTTSTEIPVISTGSFTPAFANGSFTLTTAAGNYYKMGDLVWVSYRMVWTASSGSGDLDITGFPFTTKNETDTYSGLTMIYLQGWELGASDGPPFFYFGPNGSTVFCRYAVDNGAPVKVDAGDLSGGSGQIILSGVIYVE